MVRLLPEVFVRRIDLDDLGAFLFRIFDVVVEAVEVALIDDGGVVVVVDQTGEHLLHGALRRRDELADVFFRHEHVVGREADLSGIHHLARP